MSKATAEIRGMDSAELRSKVAELRKEGFELRFHGSAEQVAKTSRHGEIKRAIARILTVLGERDRDGGTAAGSSTASEAGGQQ